MIEIPSPLQAARCIPGGDADDEQGNDEPKASVDLWKAGDAETDPKGGKRQDSAAGQGFASRLQDGETKGHSYLL